jgi:hypothetical protein
MASKDDNKRKYATDGAEEEAKEVPLRKQKMIGDDNSDGDDDDSSSSSTNDDYSSEPEEVSLQEEMNRPTGSEKELFIR